MKARVPITICAALAATIAAVLPALAQPSSAPTAPQTHLNALPPSPPTDDASALAEKLQNPVGDLVSIPLQNNINFKFGPRKGTQDVLNVQPVIPVHLNSNWNLITRTILPLVWSPLRSAGAERAFRTCTGNVLGIPLTEQAG